MDPNRTQTWRQPLSRFVLNFKVLIARGTFQWLLPSHLQKCSLHIASGAVLAFPYQLATSRLPFSMCLRCHPCNSSCSAASEPRPIMRMRVWEPAYFGLWMLTFDHHYQLKLYRHVRASRRYLWGEGSWRRCPKGHRSGIYQKIHPSWKPYCGRKSMNTRAHCTDSSFNRGERRKEIWRVYSSEVLYTSGGWSQLLH